MTTTTDKQYEEILHYAGWYNRQGQKLGWGDLSAHDMYDLQSHYLKGDDEIIVLLEEQDSYWHFVTMGKVAPEEKAPGTDYVARKARVILTPTQIYWVDYQKDTAAHERAIEELYGLKCRLIKPDEARKMIMSS